MNLRLLGRRNFGLGSVVNVVLGIGLYGCTYILPVYLGQIQGYDAYEIGKTVMWMGMPQLFLIPLVPRFMKHVDSRILIAFGVGMFAPSCLMMTNMSALTGYDQLRWPQVVRAIGQPFIIIPLSAVATAGIAAGKESGSASALFNMMRNIGGSIAIAALATVMTNREHFHSARIGEQISLFDFRTQQRLTEATAHFAALGADSWTAGWQSVSSLAGIVRRESFVMAFNDCFYLLGVALLLSAAVIPFFRHAKSRAVVPYIEATMASANYRSMLALRRPVPEPVPWCSCCRHFRVLVRRAEPTRAACRADVLELRSDLGEDAFG